MAAILLACALAVPMSSLAVGSAGGVGDDSASSSLPGGVQQTSGAPPGAAHPSAGCKVARADWSGWRSVEVLEPELGGNVLRGYHLEFPSESDCPGGLDPDAPAPLLLFFHGQSGNSKDWNSQMWTSGASSGGCAVVAYPQGINDHPHAMDVDGVSASNAERDMGSGWNVDTGGDESVCWKATDGFLTGPTQYSCYESCLQMRRCGRCNWSTCHDDVAFVKAILANITGEHCIDTTRIYAAGVSNGGMLVHHLYRRMPRAFAAVAPMNALPLLGYLNGQQAEAVKHSADLRETALIEFHDTHDQVIPIKGGIAPTYGWTWYYEPLGAVMRLWGSAHDCNIHSMVPVTIPLERAWTLDCHEFSGCTSGRRIMRCEFSGEHWQAPQDHMGSQVSVWFFNQFRRNTPASWD